MTVVFKVPYDTDANDKSAFAATGTVGSNTGLSTDVFCNGLGSWEFSPSGVIVDNVVEYPYRTEYSPRADTFIIRGRVYFKSLTSPSVAQGFIQFGIPNEDTRTLNLFINTSGDIDTLISADGLGVVNSFNRRLTFTPTLEIDTWYDLAISRDPLGIFRLFLDGDIKASGSADFTIMDPVDEPLRLGSLDAFNLPDYFLNGYMDDWSITIGDYIDANFTPDVCGLVVASTVETPLIIGTGGRTARPRSSDNRGVSASGGRVIR